MLNHSFLNPGNSGDKNGRGRKPRETTDHYLEMKNSEIPMKGVPTFLDTCDDPILSRKPNHQAEGSRILKRCQLETPKSYFTCNENCMWTVGKVGFEVKSNLCQVCFPLAKIIIKEGSAALTSLVLTQKKVKTTLFQHLTPIVYQSLQQIDFLQSLML